MIMNWGRGGEGVVKKEKCKAKITVNMNSQHNNQPVFAGMIIFIGY